MSLPTNQCFNILVLGESVTLKKSTTFNAFANYAKFKMFEEAKRHKFVEVNTAHLDLFNPESGEPLRSNLYNCDQNLIAYSFNYANNLIQFIDVPDLGEIFGDIPVNKTLDNVFNYLANLQLHAICILVKSATALKKLSFRFVIGELITRLPKCASNNVFFYYPFGPNYLCNQSEGKANLNEYLRNNFNEEKLDCISDQNCFYINGDAYKYLLCDKIGFGRLNENDAMLEEIWNNSAKQVLSMISKLFKLKPFRLEANISFSSESEVTYFDAVEQMKVDICDVIQTGKIDKQMDAVVESISSISQNLIPLIEVVDLLLRTLPSPATVCTSHKCTEVVNIQGMNKIIYKTRCHEECQLPGIAENVIGHPSMANCQVFAQSNNCNNCGCSWHSHMHQTFEYVKVKRTIFNRNKENEMINVAAIKPISEAIFTMRETLTEYQNEVLIKFANILSTNSNMIYCKFIEPYIDLLIDEEVKKDKSVYGYLRAKYDSLVEMKKAHLESVNKLIEAIKDKSHHDEVYSDEDELDISLGALSNEPSSVFKKSLPPLPEYNILLLGEKGTGKSTSINAIVNYLKYRTFEEAVNKEFEQLIPLKFTLPHPQTGEPIEIISGKDDNELSTDDSSSTQSPVGYTFRFGGGLIRLIDTPSMGDTPGVDFNFDKILNYLHYHKNLNGICILIKSTETRKTAYYRHYINQLITHLHKSAFRNIIFCFTYSRNSFYGPGDGFTNLKEFLMNELKDVQLPLKPNVNCFFIDNEAYRFLVAKKQGYPFKPKQEISFKESWDTSVEQTRIMMETIIGLEPYKLNETCSK